MYKVLIVDDEPIIRTGLSTVIDWHSLGCVVAGTAKNGEEALQLLGETVPDIVISDIKMPKMDGLELMRLLYERSEQCKAVLITGYKEFEYAQKAMAYGVRDYILKPVDQDHLTEVIGKLVAELDTEKKLLAEREQLRLQIRESIPLLRDKFMSDLLFRTPETMTDLREKLDFFHIDLQHFVLLLIAPDAYYSITRNWAEDDKLILTFLISERIEELAEKYSLELITCVKDEKVFAFLQYPENREDEKNTVLNYCGELAESVLQYGHFSVSVGVSGFYRGADKVRQARNDTEKCLAQCNALGGNSIVCVSDLVNKAHADEDEMQPCIDEWTEALKNGVKMEESLEKLLTTMEKQSNSASAKAAAGTVLMSSVRICSNEYGETDSLNTLFRESMNSLSLAGTQKEYCSVLEKFCSTLQEQVYRHTVSRNGRIIDSAKKYMSENCDREISLDETAEHVYLSKWYFSKLFKKETGKNYNDYMTELRMEKAKRVLREEPSLKTYEVAEKLGFINVRYFTQLFKKYTGMTPSEFRG